VDSAGAVLGRHDGIANFTVGQRRGLGLSSQRKLYVRSIEAESLRVVVGEATELDRESFDIERVRWVLVGEATELDRESFDIERVRWVPFERPGGPLRATVRIRSTHDGAPAMITDLGHGRARVRLDEPQGAITPGQAAVAYDGDLVLGGGWIAA